MSFQHFLNLVLFSSLLAAYPAAGMDKCLACFGLKKVADTTASVPQQNFVEVAPLSFEQEVQALGSLCESFNKPIDKNIVDSAEKNFSSLQSKAKDESQRNLLLSMTWGLLSKMPLPEHDRAFLNQRYLAWEKVTDFFFRLYIYQLRYVDAWKFQFDILNDYGWYSTTAYKIQNAKIKVNHDYLGDGGLQERAFALNGARKIITNAIKTLGLENSLYQKKTDNNMKLYIIVSIKKDRCVEYSIDSSSNES